MMKSIKTWILVVLASSLLVACGQGGGGSGSKKSKPRSLDRLSFKIINFGDFTGFGDSLDNKVFGNFA